VTDTRKDAMKAGVMTTTTTTIENTRYG